MLCSKHEAFPQSPTTNTAGCDCPGGMDTCYLLPDLTISWHAIKEGYDGRLRITASRSPNSVLSFCPFKLFCFVKQLAVSGVRLDDAGTEVFSHLHHLGVEVGNPCKLDVVPS